MEKDSPRRSHALTQASAASRFSILNSHSFPSCCHKKRSNPSFVRPQRPKKQSKSDRVCMVLHETYIYVYTYGYISCTLKKLVFYTHVYTCVPRPGFLLLTRLLLEIVYNTKSKQFVPETVGAVPTGLRGALQDLYVTDPAQETCPTKQIMQIIRPRLCNMSYLDHVDQEPICPELPTVDNWRKWKSIICPMC